MVWIRTDGPRPPLSPLYRGPFRVIKRGPKYFVVDLGTRLYKVSIDRLKVYHEPPPLRPNMNTSDEVVGNSDESTPTSTTDMADADDTISGQPFPAVDMEPSASPRPPTPFPPTRNKSRYNFRRLEAHDYKRLAEEGTTELP